jgi:drug/metabolite transporter (DMT)-like permease
MTGTKGTPQAPGAANWLLVTGLGVIWGAAFMGIATALDGFGPWWVTAGRVSLGALVLLALGAATGQPVWRLGDPRAWGFAVTVGTVAVAAPFALLSWGLQHVPSAFAGVAMGAVPLMVLPLVALFSPEEGIGPRRVAGMVLGFVGLALLVGPGALDRTGAELETLGRLACLGAAGCYAVGSVVTRRSPRVPQVAFAGATLCVASLVLLPVALWQEGVPQLRDGAGAWPVLALAYVAVFPTALAAWIRVRVITTAGSLFMSVTSYMVPVWSVIFGITLMAEALPPQLFAALGLILAGILLSQWRAIRAALGG